MGGLVDAIKKGSEGVNVVEQDEIEEERKDAQKDVKEAAKVVEPDLDPGRAKERSEPCNKVIRWSQIRSHLKGIGHRVWFLHHVDK